MNNSLRKAIKAHNNITKEALQGKGFDRHLFALKYMADINNMPTVRSKI